MSRAFLPTPTFHVVPGEIARIASVAVVALLLPLGLVTVAAAQDAGNIETLRAVASLPPGTVGLFREPTACQRTADGHTYVFDRRAHAVYRVAPDGHASQIVRIGPEPGRLLLASSFHLGPNGRFVVADAPRGRERVQIFGGDGTRLGGFTLPGRATPRVRLGSLVLNGIGSLQFTGRTILMNQPELGGLVREFTLAGHPFRTFGVFRRGPDDTDREVSLALNSGIPLVNPTGGYFFVFQTGEPSFRKYDAQGALIYHRSIQGRELDPIVVALPTTWPRRTDEEGRQLPVVLTTVRTAAVDAGGNLWVALTTPFIIYVYSPDGEKIRTVRLRGAGALQPNSLWFSPANRLLVTPGCYEFDAR